MHAAVAFGISAFVLCLVITRLCRDLFLRLNIVDCPDGVRKLQDKPIPRVGGIAIAVSYAAALALFVFLAPHGLQVSIRHKSLLLSLLLPAIVVFLTGLADDLWGLRPRAKLAGQALAAVLAVSLGARITLVSGHPVSPWVSIPLSIFWLLACSNALNLIDGLDGLATGVALFATLTSLLAALLQGNMGLVMATVPLAACLLAFLCFNFNPASAYLGDCGSLTIGFLLGCFALIWSQKSATFLGMAAPMMVLALPLIDVTLTIGRRYLGSRPIFQADREHIHHRLLALGCKPRDAAFILYGVCGVAAILSLLQSMLSDRFKGLIVVAFCALALVGIRRLNYVEFRMARRLISRRALRQLLQETTCIESLARSIDEAANPEACWNVIQCARQQLQITHVALDLDGYAFSSIRRSRDYDSGWEVSVRLAERGRLTLIQDDGVECPQLTLAALGTMQRHLIAWKRPAPEALPHPQTSPKHVPELQT